MTVKDLIEDWIAMRATLMRQLSMLKSGEMQTGDVVLDTTTKATIARLETWVHELNALLKEYASAHRS